MSGRPRSLARPARAARADCALYVDEVHNYLNLPTPLEEMLAEARGYRLSLCLAHQHLGQLPKEMREAIAANARTKLYFQLSPQDVTPRARKSRPELAAHDLAHLPRYTAAVASATTARRPPHSRSPPNRSARQSVTRGAGPADSRAAQRHLARPGRSRAPDPSQTSQDMRRRRREQ